MISVTGDGDENTLKNLTVKEWRQLLRDIQALRKLFSSPKLWVKGAEAANKAVRKITGDDDDNLEVGFYAKDAVCFCLTGGAKRVTMRRKSVRYNLLGTTRSNALVCLLREGIFKSPWRQDETHFTKGDAYSYVANWNDDDSRTFPQVKGVLLRAEKIALKHTSPPIRLPKKAA